MKILRLFSYTYPESIAASHLGNDLSNGFMESGIYTEGYAPTPSRGLSKEQIRENKKIKYLERYNGTQKIYRFPMFKEGKNIIQRAIRYTCCSVAHYRRGVKADGIDLIYSSSTPPTQGMLCAFVAKKLSKRYGRRVPFVYNLQDIFPDSMLTTKLTEKGSLIWKIGRKIEDYTYSKADKIIVISDSFKRNIMEKGVSEDKIVVISNWINTDEVIPVAKEENKLFDELGIDRNKFTVVYSGNFGEQQGADIIFDTAKLLEGSEDIQFVVFGGGSGFGAAKAYVSKHKPPNVIINDYLPKERISEIYSMGDIALVIGRKGGSSSCLPSKTWSIMSCNVPIIASFDQKSELADILSESGTGICVDAEDPQSLADAIVHFKDNPMKRMGREYVTANASKKICVSKYIEVLKSTVNASETSEKGEDK